MTETRSQSDILARIDEMGYAVCRYTGDGWEAGAPWTTEASAINGYGWSKFEAERKQGLALIGRVLFDFSDRPRQVRIGRLARFGAWLRRRRL